MSEKLRDMSSTNPVWNEMLRRGDSVVVEDVLADAAFEPHWAVAASAGFRAMQLTPLINQNKEFHRSRFHSFPAAASTQ